MIIMVIGLPATGKSWFSRQLAERMDASYLNTDVIRDRLKKKGHYDKKTKQEVYNELKNQALEKIKKNVNVIVDGSFHLQERREQFMEIAQETDTRIYFIEIKSSEKTVKKRLKSHREFSEADYKVYKKLKSEFEPLEIDHLELWNDSAHIETLISKTKNYLEDKENHG